MPTWVGRTLTHNPAPFTDCPKPDPVFRVSGEVIVVNLYNQASLNQCRSDWVYS
jgi:hypothetical protein